MRALMIFSSLNDLKYICTDAEFRRHIHNQAVKEGLLQDSECLSSHVDPNVVMQLLSPLVASQRFMSGQLHNPYHSITLATDPPFCFAFQQFSDHLYLALGGNEEKDRSAAGHESQVNQFLHRQLMILHSIVTFLYGPVLEELYPASLRLREERHQLVTHMINTWNSLYNQEQGFLLEAVERLMVRDRSLNSTCIDILGDSLNTMKTAGEKGANHSMILVNNKLLAQFSSRSASEIPPVNILLTLILVGATFPSAPENTDTASYTSLPGSETHDSNRDSPWGVMDQSGFEHQSIRSHSSSVTGGRGPVKIGGNKVAAASAEVSQSGESTSETQESSDDHKRPSSATSSDLDHDNATRNYSLAEGGPYPELSSLNLSASIPNLNAFPFEDPALDVTMETEIAQEASESGADHESKSGRAYEVSALPVEHHRSMVGILRTVTRAYSPHVLHCFQVNPGTVAVIACEMPRSRMAAALSELLSLIRAILHGNLTELGLRNGKHAQDMVDVCVKKIVNASKKLKEGSGQRLVKDIQNKWEASRGSELQSCLDNTQPIIDRLERQLLSILELSKRIFQLLYLIHNRLLASDEEGTLRHVPSDDSRQARADIRSALKRLQQTFQEKLQDYQHYLPIKAVRNITMATYYSYFPGLVHFIYVDRKTAQITAPAMYVSNTTDTPEVDMTEVVRKQLWYIVPWIQKQLTKGYTSMIVRRGDFVFTYFLWFEDPMGNAIQIQQPFRGKDDGLLPGILAGDFYRALTRDCFPGLPQKSVGCFELLCVHTSAAPTPYILHHCRKLARELWGSANDANSPISLL